MHSDERAARRFEQSAQFDRIVDAGAEPDLAKNGQRHRCGHRCDDRRHIRPVLAIEQIGTKAKGFSSWERASQVEIDGISFDACCDRSAGGGCRVGLASCNLDYERSIRRAGVQLSLAVVAVVARLFRSSFGCYC